MNWLFMIFVAVCVTEIATNEIYSKIKEYFESPKVKSFENQWKKHQISFEFATSLALQQGYGFKSLNIYINRFLNPLAVSSGYYHTDNQVHFVLENMFLDELPHIYDAEVTFPLASNVISVDASVTKMIVRSDYYLFRNQSDVIFSLSDQKADQNSPFRFQQVRNTGELTMIIEGCTLSGVMIATLCSSSVNLGSHQFRLTECQYNLEIYTPGSGAPPVMAPYYPKGPKGLNIEYLLLRPLLEELVPKLQAIMYSNVNTSAVFNENLRDYRMKQENIVEETKSYVEAIVFTINQKAINKHMGTTKLEDFTIVWDDPFEQLTGATAVSLSDMVLVGLDTLYSAHMGGPYKLPDIEISEQLRFGTLEVIGNISVKGFQEENEFAIEVSDVAVDITLDSSSKAKFEVVGWRFLEFSCPNMEFLPVEPFVVGYLLNEIPRQIISHLNSAYDGASSLHSPLSDYSQEELLEEEDAFEGKYKANTDEIKGHNSEPVDGYNSKSELEGQNSEPVVELNFEISSEDEKPLIDNLGAKSSKQVLAGDVENEQVKLNYLAEKSNVEGQGAVKLYNVAVEPHLEEKDQVKVHHVGVEPHEEEQGEVKLYHIAIEPHEEKVKLKADTSDAGKKTILHGDLSGNLSLTGGVAPSEANQGQVKLNYLAETSHVEEKGQVKVHNVAVEPHVEDDGPIKLHNVAVVPHVEEDGPVKLNYIAAVPYNELKENKTQEMRQGAGRNNSYRKRNKSQVRVKLPIRKSNNSPDIKRANSRLKEVGTTTRKSIHMSDNEIHQNKIM